MALGALVHKKGEVTLAVVQVDTTFPFKTSVGRHEVAMASVCESRSRKAKGGEIISSRIEGETHD